MQKVLSQKIKRHRFLLRKTEPHLKTRISPLNTVYQRGWCIKRAAFAVTFTVCALRGIIVSHISGGGAGKQEFGK